MRPPGGRTLQYKWSGPTYGTQTRYCDVQSAQPVPSSLQIGISTSFRLVFASPRPEIPTFPGKFCLYTPHRPHRPSIRNCRCKAHRVPELGGLLLWCPPPIPAARAFKSRAQALRLSSLGPSLGFRGKYIHPTAWANSLGNYRIRKRNRYYM